MRGKEARRCLPPHGFSGCATFWEPEGRARSSAMTGRIHHKQSRVFSPPEPDQSATRGWRGGRMETSVEQPPLDRVPEGAVGLPPYRRDI
jgi:hypothetical protein